MHPSADWGGEIFERNDFPPQNCREGYLASAGCKQCQFPVYGGVRKLTICPAGCRRAPRAYCPARCCGTGFDAGNVNGEKRWFLRLPSPARRETSGGKC